MCYIESRFFQEKNNSKESLLSLPGPTTPRSLNTPFYRLSFPSAPYLSGFCHVSNLQLLTFIFFMTTL